MDGGCGSGTVGSQAAALPWPWAQIVGKQPPAFGVALASGNPSRVSCSRACEPDASAKATRSQLAKLLRVLCNFFRLYLHCKVCKRILQTFFTILERCLDVLPKAFHKHESVGTRPNAVLILGVLVPNCKNFIMPICNDV
jgi:hypothetical protein